MKGVPASKKVGNLICTNWRSRWCAEQYGKLMVCCGLGNGIVELF